MLGPLHVPLTGRPSAAWKLAARSAVGGSLLTFDVAGVLVVHPVYVDCWHVIVVLFLITDMASDTKHARVPRRGWLDSAQM
jgi:hypothetical protein